MVGDVGLPTAVREDRFLPMCSPASRHGHRERVVTITAIKKRRGETASAPCRMAGQQHTVGAAAALASRCRRAHASTLSDVPHRRPALGATSRSCWRNSADDPCRSRAGRAPPPQGCTTTAPLRSEPGASRLRHDPAAAPRTTADGQPGVAAARRLPALPNAERAITTAMQADDLPDDGEPMPWPGTSPRCPARMPRENRLALVGRNARTVVPDDEAQPRRTDANGAT